MLKLENLNQIISKLKYNIFNNTKKNVKKNAKHWGLRLKSLNENFSLNARVLDKVLTEKWISVLIGADYPCIVSRVELA